MDHDAFNLSLPRNPERTLHGLASMLDARWRVSFSFLTLITEAPVIWFCKDADRDKYLCYEMAMTYRTRIDLPNWDEPVFGSVLAAQRVVSPFDRLQCSGHVCIKGAMIHIKCQHSHTRSTSSNGGSLDAAFSGPHDRSVSGSEFCLG